MLEVVGITIAGLTLIYMAFGGSKTLPELLRKRRTRSSPPATLPGISNPQLEQGATAVTTVTSGSDVVYQESGRLTVLAASDQGDEIAVGGFLRKVSVVDLNTRLATLDHEHTAIVRALAFDRSRNALVSAGDSGAIHISYPSDGEFAQFHAHEGPIYAVTVAPNGRHLVSAGRDGAIRFWDIDKVPRSRIGMPFAAPTKMTPSMELKHTEGAVFGVDFLPDGFRLVSCGVHGVVRMWNIASAKSEALAGFSETVFGIRCHPSGDSVAAGGAGGSIRTWSFISGDAELLSGHRDAVRWLAYDADGDLLASASKDSSVRLWQLSSGRCWVLDGHSDYVYCVEFATNDHTLLSCAGDGTVRQWTIPSGARTKLTKLGVP